MRDDNSHEADYPSSYYAATARGIVEHPVLTGPERADVCVIGGGFTGVSASTIRASSSITSGFPTMAGC